MNKTRARLAVSLLLTAFSAMHGFAQTKVALVLAGGSAYGLSHIGVIKVIEEIGIPIDIVVGTSMGSIVGGLYSIGYNAADLEKIASETDWTGLLLEKSVKGSETIAEMRERSRFSTSVDFDRRGFMLRGGLLTGNKILRFVDSLTLSVPSPADYDALPRKFRAVATDVENGGRVVMSKGNIADSMRASMSLPGVFTPYSLDGKYLIDGCMVDNLPIRLAREMGADIVIAVDLYDGKPFDPETGNRTPLLALGRSLDILLRANVKQQLCDADLVISVDLQGYLSTDFTKAKIYADIGEAKARESAEALRAILARIQDAEGEIRNGAKTIAPLPPVMSVRIEGISGRDKAAVQALFKPITGTSPDTATLQKLFHELDRYGKFESIRLRRDFSDPALPLVVTLKEKSPEKHEIRLNFLYESTLAASMTGNFNLIPSLAYRGLTTADSTLIIDAELLDSPGLAVRFVQPFAKSFYVSPFYLYQRDFSTRLVSSRHGYQSGTVFQSAGFQAAFQGIAGFELSAGWSFDLIDNEAIPELSQSAAVDSASLIHASMQMDTLDSPIFPMRGFSSTVDLLVSREALGSEREFTTLKIRGSAVLYRNKPFSGALLWTAGTDFSEGPDDGTEAPLFYQPDLSGRRMFPGPLIVSERIGNYVAGLGIELKHNLNWQNTGIKFPVFILFDTAVGAAVQGPGTIDPEDGVLHWNAALGLGVRISDAFGVAFRAGLQQGRDLSYSPFIALDLGAMGY
jgi:NTE family protein